MIKKTGSHPWVLLIQCRLSRPTDPPTQAHTHALSPQPPPLPCRQGRVVNRAVILKHVFRQKDQAFVQALNELRTGTLSPQSVDMFNSCRPKAVPASTLSEDCEPVRLFGVCVCVCVSVYVFFVHLHTCLGLCEQIILFVAPSHGLHVHPSTHMRGHQPIHPATHTNTSIYAGFPML